MERKTRTHGPEELLERQSRRWEKENLDAPSPPATPRPVPVITISREYGALGAALGRRVAAQLGFHAWDEEIVDAVAADLPAGKNMLANLDEHSQDIVEEFFGVVMFGPHSSVHSFHHHLVKVLQTIAAHGAAVIIGRGAEFVLPRESALRVHCVCEKTLRIHGISARHGISLDAARAKVDEVDHDRASFLKRHHGRRIGEFSDYDLVVNTGTIPVEAAAQVVVTAYRARFGAAETAAPPVRGRRVPAVGESQNPG